MKRPSSRRRFFLLLFSFCPGHDKRTSACFSISSRKEGRKYRGDQRKTLHCDEARLPAVKDVANRPVLICAESSDSRRKTSNLRETLRDKIPEQTCAFFSGSHDREISQKARGAGKKETKERKKECGRITRTPTKHLRETSSSEESKVDRGICMGQQAGRTRRGVRMRKNLRRQERRFFAPCVDMYTLSAGRRGWAPSRQERAACSTEGRKMTMLRDDGKRDTREEKILFFKVG